MKFFSRALALGLLAPLQLQAATILHCGKLIDVDKLTVLEQRSVRVEGERIVQRHKGFSEPATGDNVVDLKTATCMPGLMDMHVHLAHEFSAHTYINNFKLNGPEFAHLGETGK